MHVVLVRPEIAPNTGNIIRLCANTGASLHLVGPLGFQMTDRLLRRAGLDYHELADVHVYDNIEAFPTSLAKSKSWYAFSSSAASRYDTVRYGADDVVVFGAESAGLHHDDVAALPIKQMLTLPMRPGNRSLNLSNAVAVVVYEAWRQLDFHGAAPAKMPT